MSSINQSQVTPQTDFFLWSSYEKDTCEMVATYIPYEFYPQLQDLLVHYRSEKDHATQFQMDPTHVNAESVTAMVKGISYFQKVEFVQCLGKMELPTEITTNLQNTDPTQKMLSLLSHGRIALYFERLVKGARLTPIDI